MQRSLALLLCVVACSPGSASEDVSTEGVPVSEDEGASDTGTPEDGEDEDESGSGDADGGSTDDTSDAGSTDDTSDESGEEDGLCIPGQLFPCGPDCFQECSEDGASLGACECEGESDTTGDDGAPSPWAPCEPGTVSVPIGGDNSDAQRQALASGCGKLATRFTECGVGANFDESTCNALFDSSITQDGVCCQRAIILYYRKWADSIPYTEEQYYCWPANTTLQQPAENMLVGSTVRDNMTNLCPSFDVPWPAE